MSKMRIPFLLENSDYACSLNGEVGWKWMEMMFYAIKCITMGWLTKSENVWMFYIIIIKGRGCYVLITLRYWHDDFMGTPINQQNIELILNNYFVLTHLERLAFYLTCWSYFHARACETLNLHNDMTLSHICMAYRIYVDGCLFKLSSIIFVG